MPSSPYRISSASPRALLRRWTHRAALGAGVLLLAATGAAQDADPDPRTTEARERFDRGLTLVNQNDNGGALAEFLRAYEIKPHPIVLFNIGLVYATVGDSVRAVEALDRLIAAPAGLDSARLARARSERAQQALRIAELDVTCSVAGATIDIDGLPAGTTPLPGPLRVPTGQHIVAAVAKGYTPLRRIVTVASGTRTPVELVLETQEGDAATLVLTTRLPGAQVLVDGQVVGETPLAAPLAVAPGSRRFALRRPGYVALERVVVLPAGSTGRLELEPTVDSLMLEQEGGTLSLMISEPDAVLFVDGAPRGAYAGAFRLPHGEHRLRVERAGFFPFERDVSVPSRSNAAVAIDLEPTPEKRAAYVGGAQSWRTASLITLGAGAAVTLGSVGFLIATYVEEGSAKQHFDQLASDNTAGSNTTCDPTTDAPRSCLRELELALESLEDVRARAPIGWVGLGVGALATGIGLTLLLAGDDPERYEPKPESDVFGALTPRAWFGPNGGGLGLSGTFF